MVTDVQRGAENRTARLLALLVALAFAVATAISPSAARANGGDPVPPDYFVCVATQAVGISDPAAEEPELTGGVGIQGGSVLLFVLFEVEVWGSGTRPEEIEDCEPFDFDAWAGSAPEIIITLSKDDESLLWTTLDSDLEAEAEFTGVPDTLAWIVSLDGRSLSVSADTGVAADDFLVDSSSDLYDGIEGFEVSDLYFGYLLLTLPAGVPLGVYTLTMDIAFPMEPAGIGPMAEAAQAFTVSTVLTIVGPEEPAVPAGPTASVSCSAPTVGGSVTCDLTSEPEFDFIWRASTNPVFATGVVTTNADGVGQFTFTVPRSALGGQVLVEIVDWTAATPIGVAAGPVPTSVPSGEGPRLPVEGLLLGAVALGAALLVRSGYRVAAGVEVD
jgi:hypothetical protein